MKRKLLFLVILISILPLSLIFADEERIFTLGGKNGWNSVSDRRNVTTTSGRYGYEALENVNSPKVVVNNKMEALYFSRSIIPFTRGKEKEEWLKGHTYYKHIGLYAYRANVLKEITSLPQSSLEIAESLEQLRWLENGYKIKVGISEIETIGIDFARHKGYGIAVFGIFFKFLRKFCRNKSFLFQKALYDLLIFLF